MGNIASIFDPKTHDVILVDKDHPYVLQARRKREEMSGWDRVRDIFTLDDLGDWTPELYRVRDATTMAMVVGAALGGFGRSRISYMDFFRRNAATQFETPLQAKSALQDQVSMGFAQGAWRVGWRLTAFTFMYMTGATVIAAYRNKYGVIDQIGGASLAGFLYKFKEGPKPAVAGATIGAMLGLVAGSMTLASVKMFGLDLERANAEYYARLGQRKEKEVKYTRILREMEATDELDKMHTSFIVKPGKKDKDKAKEEKDKAVTNESSSKDKDKEDVISSSVSQNQIQKNAA